VDTGRYPAHLELLTYRTLEELVTNVRRHSGSRTLRVSVLEEDGELVGVVEDAGCGFDPEPVAHGGRPQTRLELAAARVYLTGGSLTIDSQPGHGTRAELRLPLGP